jgi:MoxR-like ATPase
VFLDELNRCPENARNALMPALDASRRIFHPVENRFLEIPANVQFIAAVNRGSTFSGTFGIDAAQLDRFAPLQMGYPPVEEEVKLLRPRHHELSDKIVKLVVEIAHRLRQLPELAAGLSVRATDEVCTYLKHPIIATQRKSMFPAILKSSFCGRFSGHWNDAGTDAGVAWGIIQAMLKEKHVLGE